MFVQAKLTHLHPQSAKEPKLKGEDEDFADVIVYNF